MTKKTTSKNKIVNFMNDRSLHINSQMEPKKQNKEIMQITKFLPALTQNTTINTGDFKNMQKHTHWLTGTDF